MRHEFADGQFSVEQPDFNGRNQWSLLNWEDARLTASAFPARRLSTRTNTFVCTNCGGQDFEDHLPCLCCGE